MDIFSLQKSGPIKNDLFAVGFFFREDAVFHVGAWFIEDQNEEPKFLHLAHHCALRTERPADGFWIKQGIPAFWIRSGVTERQARFLAGKCAEISECNGKGAVPFSIFYDTGRLYFDDTGSYIPSDVGEGLTCATFLMAIFAQLGIPLLLMDSWASDAEDAAWHLQIIAQMREGKQDQEHFEKQLGNVGCSRYRPADVVIASSKKMKDRPVPQAVVRKAHGALHKRTKQLTA